MMKKKYMKDSMSFVTGGVALGVGSSVLGSIGGTAAGNAQAGLSKLSSAYPAVGGIYGAGMVMDSLGKLKKATKKKY